jgi:flagellar FliL protein
MAEEIDNEADEPKKKSGKLGLIIGLVLALGGGGGAFYAVQSGIVLGASDEHAEEEHVEEEVPKIAFVPIDAMIIPMGKQSRYQLRFQAQLEVAPLQVEQVTHVMPRILDILNGYLRAVDVEELADPSSLLKLRAQMLRRVQLVTGRDQVKDLLITEFVFG